MPSPVHRPSRANRTTVSVFMRSRDDFHHGIVRGVARFALHHDWLLRICPDHVLLPTEHLLQLFAQYPADACIVQGLDRGELTAALAGRRVVTVAGRPPGFTGPSVRVDDRAAGRQAAQHLLQRGLRSFAFVGWRDAPWAAARLAGFQEALGDAGMPPHLFFMGKAALAALGREDGHWREPFVHWLADLPRPTGVLAHSDSLAAEAAAACREHGLRIPEDVAMIGMGNDRFICETSVPPLSSVRHPGVVMGYEAARLLGRLLAGQPTPEEDLVIPSLGVQSRLSTDLCAVEDPAIARAIACIRGEWQRVTVAMVEAAAGLPRRTLERRFRAAIGRSPGAEIRRVRIAEAKLLLIDTDRPIADIAVIAGFTDATGFCRAFRQETGRTPSQLRGSLRDGDED